MSQVAEIKTDSVSKASEKVVLHHLTAFQDNDLKEVMSDYTPESVIVTPDAIYKGMKEIETFLGQLMINFPKQRSTVNLDKIVSEDKLVYILWNAKTPTLEVSFATDTFIIRENKIHRQTFAGQMKFLESILI